MERLNRELGTTFLFATHDEKVIGYLRRKITLFDGPWLKTNGWSRGRRPGREMILPKLALRNLLGAGLRTWLNVIVLSFAFILIIWSQGLYEGVYAQAERASVDIIMGGGQYWQEKYDPLDILSLEDAHAVVPDSLRAMIDAGRATPILVVQARSTRRTHSSCPHQGIDPDQKLLSLPSEFLTAGEERVPALIGSRTARSTGLAVGDT